MTKELDIPLHRHFSAMFIATVCTTAKKFKQPKCPSTNKWIIKCGAYTLQNIIQVQRKMKS